MSNDPLEVPQANGADVAHIVASTIVSLVPFSGGAELLKFVLAPSLEKRKDMWMQHVADAIKELRARREFTLEILRDNDEFATLLLQTTQAAYKTHLEEKHVMLKTGLKNAYLSDLEFDIKQLYISLIDKFNPVHFAVLTVVNETKDLTLKCYSGNEYFERLLELNNPIAIATNGILFLAVLEELHQAGLLVISGNFIITDGDVYQQPAMLSVGAETPNLQKINLTDLANSFLRFLKG